MSQDSLDLGPSSQIAETDRLRALAEYSVLDSGPELSFDRLVDLAAAFFRAPLALITLFDDSRHWVKSAIGVDLHEISNESAFCTKTVASESPFVVTDATEDKDFADNPFVIGPPYVRFYAGSRLINAEGFCLGSISVLDLKPRDYPAASELHCLSALAAQVVEQLESRRTRIHLLKANMALVAHEEELRRQREEAFHLKRKIDLALEAGEMGTWEWDGSSGEIESSPVTNRLLGLVEHSCPVSLKTCEQLLHPDDRARSLEDVRACLEKGTELRAEYRIQLSPGKVRWLSCRARQRISPTSALPGLVGVCWDTTDRKLAEQAIRENQELERGWNMVSPAGMFRVDRAGRFLSIGSRVHELLGIPDQGFSDWPSLLHSSDRQVLSREWRKSIERGVQLDLDLGINAHNPDVRWIHLRLVPLRNPEDELTGFLGAVDDITAQKEAQQRLQGLQTLFQLAVDAMPQRIFWKDLDGIYQGCNQAFAADLGLGDPAEVIGKIDFDLGPAQYARIYREDDRAIMSAGVPRFNYEEFFQTASGQVTTIRTSKLPLRDAQGKVIGILGTYQDITEQRLKEQELLRARDAAEDAARAKGQFLANMSHEIRTPLNGVLGMVAFLLDSKLAPDQRRWAETAQISGEALLQLLNNVLDLSKAEAGKLTLENIPFDLLRTVQQSTELLQAEARGKNLALSVHYSPGTPHRVIGDAFRVRQILLNFLANAVKFTSEGRIDVLVSHRQLSEGEMLIRLAVKDTGIGVPPDAEHRLFHAFSQADGSTTRRFGGTGLGLSISKVLAEAIGGSVGFERNPEGGSTFWTELPFRVSEDGAAPESPAEPSNLPISPESKRVLIVEDNPVNQLVASRFVSKFGCLVDLASNGQEALELWRTRHYDLILMDGQMPELDGYQASVELRALEQSAGRQRTPIIALTAHALPGDRERCLAAGMDDYLSKPLQQEELRQALQRWLIQAGATPALDS